MEHLQIKQLKDMEVAFSKVFKAKDPFEDAFNNNIKSKLLIFPTTGYYLTQKQYASLTNLLISFEENSFYISEVEGNCFSLDQDPTSYKHVHWKMNSDCKYDEYLKIPLALENAIYSVNGRWGMIVSHEDHAIFGGDRAFIQKFKELYTDWEDDQNKFIQKWKENEVYSRISTQWVEKLLAAIDKS